MSNELMASNTDGVITAETPMTDTEFQQLSELFLKLRAGVPPEHQYTRNYYTNIAESIATLTQDMSVRYGLPTQGGRYYVVFLPTGKHLQWWSDTQLQAMNYQPAIIGQ